MINIIIFLIAQYGLTNAIVREIIFEPLRRKINALFPYSLLNKLINCETCMGFWTGMLLSWIILPITANIYADIFIAGLMASAFNKILLITLYKF